MSLNLDLTSITAESASKLWDEMNAGEAAPLNEQDQMVQYAVQSKVLPIVNVVVPTVEKAVESSLKNRLIATINEAHDAGHDPEFTLMAVLAELSEEE
jgi:hypothetical protein